MVENLKLNDSPQVETAQEISARKKILRLGRQLGLASEQDYQPANANLGQRAQFRQLKLQEQYQYNLETIYTMALSYTPSDVTGADLDADWVHQFFQMAEQIHNRRMQDLWARILASETVNPGNFSLRTLSTLRQLTLREAQLLEKALGMAVRVNQENRGKLLSSYRYGGGIGHYFRKRSAVNLGLSQFGLPYSNLLTLMDAGLLHRGEFETGLLPGKEMVRLQLQQQQLTLKPKSNQLYFGYYRFTAIGEELAQLVPPRQDDAYVEALKALLQQDFQLS